jgi:hypothetical protein
MLQEQDQTWYFALADCDGALEVFRDEKKKSDHLLGLSVLWHDIQESEDPVAYYAKYGGADKKGLIKGINIESEYDPMDLMKDA